MAMKHKLARTRVRAATMAEYAIILVGVLLLGAGAMKVLGGLLGSRADTAGNTVTNGESSSGGSSTSSSSGGSSASGGGGGGGGVGGKGSVGGGGSMGGGGHAGGDMHAASKVGMGGVGGAAGAGGGGGGGGGAEGENGGGGQSGSSAVAGNYGGDYNVDEGFTFKKWFGIAMLAAGLLAITYVLFSMRRAKKAADAVGPEKDGKGKLKAGANLPPPPSLG